MDKSHHQPSENRTSDSPQKEVYYSASRIRRGLIYYLSGRGITVFAAVLVPLLFVRTLSVSDYAGYTAFSGLLILMGELSDVGLSKVLPRYIPDLRNAGAEAQLRYACRWMLLIKAGLLTVVLSVLIMLYPIIAGWLKLPVAMKLVWSFTIYAFSFNMSNFIAVNLQSLMLQKQLVFAMALEWYVKLLVLCIALFSLGSINLLEALLIQGCTAALGMLYMLWQLEKHFASRKNKASRQAENILDWQQMVKTGRHNYFWVLTGMYSKPAVIKLISACFFSQEVTAALGFAYAIANVVQRYMPSFLLNQIIEPTIMAKYTENYDFKQSVHYFSIVLKVNLLILIPLTGWFYFYGNVVVNLIANGKYHHIVWIISWLLINLVLQSVTSLLQQASNAVQKSELLLRCNIRILLFFLLPAAMFVYLLGLPGLLASLTAIFFYRNFYITRRLREYGYHFSSDWQGIGKILAATVGALVVTNISMRLIENNIILCLASLGIGVIVFLGLMVFINPFPQSERKTINNLLGRKLFNC